MALLVTPFRSAYRHGHKVIPDPGKRVIPMARYYANGDERGRLIAGFRALADFLQDHPDVPAPRWTDVMVFPPDGTDEEMRAEIDLIAARIGAEPADRTADHGHYTASRSFGPVEYRAVAICAYARPYQHATDEKGA